MLKIKSFKQFITEAITTLHIPDSIKSNYNLNGDFSNVANWEVLSYVKDPEEMYSDPKHNYKKVGYILINPSKKLYIPLARSDEHHKGMEILQDVLYKKGVPRGGWVSFWALDSTDYPRDDEKELYIEAVKLFVENGGDISKKKVRASNSSKIIPTETFIRTGVLDYEKGTLHPEGTKLINSLKELSKLDKDAISASRTGKDKQLDIITKNMISKTKALLEWFENLYPNDMYYKVKGLKEFIKKALIDIDKIYDHSAIEQLLFSFKGFKNLIHLGLKSDDEDIKEANNQFFGDSEMAKGIFDNL